MQVSTALARASGYMRAHGAKELWPYFQNFCNLSCEYGYLTDVEGNYVCLCHDPCQVCVCTVCVILVRYVFAQCVIPVRDVSA